MATHTASIRLDDDKLSRLDRLAAAIDRSRSWAINQAIEQYLDHEEWFTEAVREGVAAADRGELVPHHEAVAAARELIAKGRHVTKGHRGGR